MRAGPQGPQGLGPQGLEALKVLREGDGGVRKQTRIYGPQGLEALKVLNKARRSRARLRRYNGPASKARLRIGFGLVARAGALAEPGSCDGLSLLFVLHKACAP